MLIRKADAPKQAIPEEIVTVEELGGDVLVRGLSLTARLELSHESRERPSEGKFDHIVPLLARSVLDADEQPLYTEAEWSAFGAAHLVAAVRLWDIAWKLSDLDGAQAAKNSSAPTSA